MLLKSNQAMSNWEKAVYVQLYTACKAGIQRTTNLVTLYFLFWETEKKSHITIC